MSATSDFPHTLSGWVVLALPFMLAGVGWLIRRLITKVDDLNGSQVEVIRAAAVLASQFADVRTATGKNTDDIGDLKTATAVLKSWNDHHDQWAQSQSERLMDHIRHA